MIFKDEAAAPHFFANISYYRLKGYWWDMQANLASHTFNADTYLEDIIDRYNFDRQLRLILFDAIERIEIALRTKMIYILSLKFGGLWYLDPKIFQTRTIEINGQRIRLQIWDTVYSIVTFRQARRSSSHWLDLIIELLLE